MSREGYLGLGLGVLDIIFGVLQSMFPVIPPIVGWPIIALLGLVAFVLIDKGIREKGETGKQTQPQEARVIEPPKGSLDNVTSDDRLFILRLAMHMSWVHGCFDFDGLLADRASGIELNALMTRNCSICKTPRNERRKTHEN